MPVSAGDLDRCLCWRVQRQVGRDNTVVVGKQVLQIPKQSGRRSCQGLRVTVRHHLDGRYTVTAGPRLLATFDRSGRMRCPDPDLKETRDRRAPRVLRTRVLPAGRRRRSSRAPMPVVQVSPQRPDHLSRLSGQITC